MNIEPPWKELVHEYADGPDRLARELAGLSDTQLDRRLTADTWSIRQIAHHIVDGDDIWNTCIKAALGNQAGEFSLKWYWDVPQTEWTGFWQYEKRSLETSLALFKANRAHIVELLNLIPDAQLRSCLIRWPGNPEIEPVRVEQIVKMHVDHLKGHLQDIKSIETM